MQSEKYLSQGQRIVLCHGHFNVVHPGHLRFLHYAKSLGDVLVVGVLGDSKINDAEENARYFKEEDRAIGLAALESIDHVIILNELSTENLVRLLKPSTYVLGREYARGNHSSIRNLVAAVQVGGGEVVYHAGDLRYATTELLHGTQSEWDASRAHQYSRACERQSITLEGCGEHLNNIKNSHLLIIGDTIVDQYAACDPLGMSAEAPVVVVRELETREFIGGAAVVASHIRALGVECTYISVVGDDEPGLMVRRDLKARDIGARVITDVSRPTTFKIRYMVDKQKLFRVSRLREHPLPSAIEDQIIASLEELVPESKGIVVCDFVYGMITSRVLKSIQELAERHNVPLFGDLQCSSQIGNLLKFRNFDLLCPTEREARIALSNQEDGIEWIAQELLGRSGSRNLVMKMGSEGFIAYSREQESDYILSQPFPALAENAVDVTGAGDSLLATMAIMLSTNATMMEASALGVCVAALAVQTVGNVPITREQVQAFIRERRYHLEQSNPSFEVV
ncbi:PfkB family carbohydrate kinase [Pseudomonadota bacterium]